MLRPPDILKSNVDIVLFCPEGVKFERLQNVREFLKTPFEVSSTHHVWAMRIEEELSQRIMYACSKSGEYGHSRLRPNHPFNPAYAFVTETSERPPDSLEVSLNQCVHHSRIIYPTSIGFQYSAHFRWFNGELIINPIDIIGINSRAFIASEILNNCFEPRHFYELKEFLDNFENVHRLAQNLDNAFFNYSLAFHNYYADQRWLNIAVGLEGISKIKDERGGGSKNSFVKRWLGISKRVQFPLSESELDKFYELRSDIAHGIPVLSYPDNALYVKAENLLRLTLLKCINDPEFRVTISDKIRLAREFPISIRT